MSAKSPTFRKLISKGMILNAFRSSKKQACPLCRADPLLPVSWSPCDKTQPLLHRLQVALIFLPTLGSPERFVPSGAGYQTRIADRSAGSGGGVRRRRRRRRGRRRRRRRRRRILVRGTSVPNLSDVAKTFPRRARMIYRDSL